MHRLEQVCWQILTILIILPIAFVLAFHVMHMLLVVLAPIIAFGMIVLVAIIVIAGCLALISYIQHHRHVPRVATPPPHQHRTKRVPITVQPARRPRRTNR